jgi:hypothetical protein
MDRTDKRIGSFVMGRFRYPSFVGIATQLANPAPTNWTPLGKPCSSMLLPEDFLISRWITRGSLTNRTESTMEAPNEKSSEANLTYGPKDNSSLTGAAFRGIGLFLAMWRDPQGDGRMRPGDWLILLIGSALIIGSALELL